MIKLIKEDSKYRLVNTEKVFINSKNNVIFINKDIKFSFCDDIEDIGEFEENNEMINLIIDTDNDNDYIPIIDIEITQNVFYFIKDEFENITKNYGNILEYEIIENNENTKNEEFDTNIVKKDVLKVEFEKVFDKWGCRIVYQNFDILERFKFRDGNINVSSLFSIEYNKDKDIFYILGNNEKEDNKIIIIDDEDKKVIEHKVKLINEKYGIEKRWRAEKGKEYYYMANSNFSIKTDFENNDSIDDTRYKIGNYFRTKELAESKLKEIKELLLK